MRLVSPSPKAGITVAQVRGAFGVDASIRKLRSLLAARHELISMSAQYTSHVTSLRVIVFSNINQHVLAVNLLN